MNIEDRLRRAADSINADLESVPVPEPPERHRRGWVRLVVAAVFALVMVGSILWVIDGRGTPPAASDGSSTSTTNPTLEEEAPEREPPTPQPAGPTVVIAEGTVEGSEETWRLSAFISTEGNLCMNLNGLGCGPIPNAAVPLSSPSTSVRDVPGPRLSCASGGLSEQASAVVLTFTDGTVFRPMIHSGGELPANFYAHCWGGNRDLAILEVFDIDGETLAETVTSYEGSVFGVWELVDLDGRPMLARPSVTFSLSPDLVPRIADPSGEVRPDLFGLSGYTGCNAFSGAFDVKGHDLVVEIDFMTFRGCGDVEDEQAAQLMGEQELQFTSFLRNAATWAIDGDQLTITSQDGEVATFREVAGDTIIGVWRLVELDGQPPADTERDLSVTFFTENRLGGWAGCNSLGGIYKVDDDQVITTINTVTNRECDEAAREQGQRFISILERADSWRVDGEHLTITSDTAGVIVLRPAGT